MKNKKVWEKKFSGGKWLFNTVKGDGSVSNNILDIFSVEIWKLAGSILFLSMSEIWE